LTLQRDVVRNERRQSYENRPYGRSELVVAEEMYPPAHPYHWPVIGSHEDLQAATLADVRDFFRRFYAPKNASLVIAGDFRGEEARRWVERYFGWIPSGGAAAPARPRQPTLGRSKERTIRDRVRLPRVEYVFHTAAAHRPGDAEIELFAGILGGGKSS